ncbi:protein angel homolog 2 isoform X2 [Bacillus rossius redtenbacheri]|uniref:protein angel homolog 2 isoform X2 n=1 Tax=Bacillus rossius redtenbacheri TaxID=93214 RepID=UPI002FDD52D1
MISEKNSFTTFVCLFSLPVLYYIQNYVLNTSPPETPGSSESSLKIIDSHIIKNVFEKAVGVGVTPLQYQDIKSWTASNKEAKTSQGGQCLVEPGRYWIYSETMMEDASKWRKFKLMSYNVLSQSLLEEHPYLYTQNDPRTLDWNFRSRLLFAEIQNLNADILCLQEVENEHVYLFERQLQMLGYRGIYKKRSHKRVDGVAIFYKADTFVLQEYTSVEFFQPNVPVLNRDNVALIAKLAHRDLPGQSVVVATTHLLFNMNRHDVKLAQTQLLMAEVERFAYSGVGKFGPKYFPVVITGDMNFTPFSGVYKFLTEGRLRYKGLFKKNLTDRYGSGAVFNNTLLPRSLHVMDSCQHWGILPLREKGTPDRRDEMKRIKVYNSDFTLLRKIQSPWDMKFGEDATSGKLPHPGTLQLMDVSSEVEKDTEDGKDGLPSDRFETGVLTHPFNLHSAYTDHDSEVTTHHKKWVTVDYVFYSVPKDELESGLTLLATYKLPTFDEATRSGPIPNFKSPSDHYPLLVMFGLNSDVQKMQH